jgi:hypothetical protein
MHEYRVRQARLLGDSGALHVALRGMREAALDSGNSSAMLLAAAVYERTMRTQHPPPRPAAKLGQPATSELPLVGAFLQGDAQRALYMLSQYANGGECYLYWLKGGKLELAASLDKREPPAILERVLSALPVNDLDRPRDLSLSQETASGYTVVRLVDSADSCVALAALRGVRSGDIAIPAALISDIGRALSAGSGNPA